MHFFKKWSKPSNLVNLLKFLGLEPSTSSFETTSAGQKKHTLIGKKYEQKYRASWEAEFKGKA